MDKQAKLQKKREQRHRRELTGKLDKTISDYVHHKYPNIYAEAKEYYDELNAMYPSKKDLIKTVEHAAWKKIQGQRASSNKQLELKIQLMRSKKTTIESSNTIITKKIPSRKEKNPTVDPTVVNENTPPVNEISSTELDENTPLVNEISSTELDEIAPSLNAEIPPQLVQEIIDELRGDKDLHEYCLNMFPDNDDVEMAEYVLEEELY